MWSWMKNVHFVFLIHSSFNFFHASQSAGVVKTCSSNVLLRKNTKRCNEINFPSLLKSLINVICRFWSFKLELDTTTWMAVTFETLFFWVDVEWSARTKSSNERFFNELLLGKYFQQLNERQLNQEKTSTACR